MQEPERFSSPAYLAVLHTEISTQTCRFSPEAEQAIREQAEAGYPLEICGLLIGRYDDSGWQVAEARAVANLNSERAADRFQLDPAGYQAVDRELRSSDLEIIGVYHSHPDCPAKPSPTDLESAWEGLLYPIASIHQGRMVELHCWALDEESRTFQTVKQQ